MGRPIQKKYFGNTNVPPVGGEAVATISTGVVGSFVVNNTYQNFPQIVIGAPNLPGGVQATADVVYELDTVTYASGGQTDGDYLPGLSTSIVGLGGGAVVNIVETANKVTSVNLTGGNRGEFRRGDITGAGISTFQVLQAPNPGTDLQITVTFRVKSITVLNGGGGYTSAPSISWTGHTFTGQTPPSGQTATLTTTNANAIAISAFVVGGSSAVSGDIVKQEASRRYLVSTAQGTSDCGLVAAPPLAGEMTMTATDSAGGTYYPIKLTQAKATIVKGGRTGTQFNTGSSVLSAISRSNGLVSATTSAPHGFGNGAQVYIFGVTGSTDTFNGVYNIKVTSTTAFTFYQNGANESGTVGANSCAATAIDVDWVIAPATATAGVSVVILTV